MFDFLIKKFLVLIILLWLNVFGGLIISCNLNQSEVEVIFFDVGQGDAILIQAGTRQVLIDGGQGDSILGKLSQVVPWFDRKIDLIILTHRDSDHLSGLLSVIKHYSTDLILDNQYKCSSKKCSAWEKTLQEKSLLVKKPQLGQIIYLTKQIKLLVLHPGQENYPDNNQSSGVVKLITPKASFLLTSDIDSVVEQQLINKSINLTADILKVPHHGSASSSSNDFLQHVNARAGIISVGKNNPYGHPAKSVLERLQKQSMHILRTDKIGDIRFCFK